MSIQSLRGSLDLLDTTPGAQSSFKSPSRTIYHQIARDVMLIQGIHYSVEEALANVGELGSLDPLLDPRRLCLLRLQQNLIDIARISENIQESMLRNITNHASNSQASKTEEEPTPQSVTQDYGSLPLPTAFVSAHPCIEYPEELIISRLEPLPCRSDSKRLMSSPSEHLAYQVTPNPDHRSKRKTPTGDGHAAQPPPAKRPRLSSNDTIYLRPTYQKRERTSIFCWARRMLTAPRQ